MQKPLATLRAAGLNVAVDTTGRKIGAMIQTAEKKGIGFVLFIGEQEIADERYSLKNLQTGAEEKHGISRIVTMVKDHRLTDTDDDDDL